MPTGAELVRADFNPNSNPEVAEVKRRVAELIDFVNESKDKDPRLAALATTAFEEGAMWAVKLVTTPEVKEHT